MVCSTYFARSWSCLGSSCFPLFTILFLSFLLNSSARAMENMQPQGPCIPAAESSVSPWLKEEVGQCRYLSSTVLGWEIQFFFSLTSFRNLTDSSHMPRRSDCFVSHVEGQLKKKGKSPFGATS